MRSQTIKLTILTISILVFLVACATTDAPEATPPEAAPVVPAQPAPAEDVSGVSYVRNIQPIMAESCTPCHYPERGKKELLDTYDATARFIDDIIFRVQLPADSSEFMPYKSKKMPLTLDQIQLLIDWRDAGMPD